MSVAVEELSAPPFTAVTFSGTNGLPLVIEPDGREQDPARWVAANPGWVATKLRQHGALLFRGFPIFEPPQFERLARAISPKLQNGYLGTSPRDALTEYVFSASELPPYYPIPQHCEMAFTKTPPARLFFHCMVQPEGEGGETPLVDFRRVLKDLDPTVRQKFETRGVRNIRNYDGPEGKNRRDLWKLKRWDEMFRTTDRAEVERTCAQQGFEFQWKPGGKLALINTQPATRTHPETGEQVWFNHSQVFHLSAAAGEFQRIAKRQRPVQSRALKAFAEAMTRVKSASQAPEEQAMHCTYGDGSEISFDDMEKVRDAIWKNMVTFRWQLGDVVAIDNFAVSHGRMPYRGPRVITVCWA